MFDTPLFNWRDEENIPFDTLDISVSMCLQILQSAYIHMRHAAQMFDIVFLISFSRIKHIGSILYRYIHYIIRACLSEKSNNLLSGNEWCIFHTIWKAMPHAIFTEGFFGKSYCFVEFVCLLWFFFCVVSARQQHVYVCARDLNIPLSILEILWYYRFLIAMWAHQQH